VVGESIVAFIVPEKGAGLTKDNVREALKLTLPAFKRPAHIELVNSILTDAAGKTDRAQLEVQFGSCKEPADD
jgi:acyl-CoA synthetase (AMP-forming)/AMP-acid ligase II